LSTDRATPSNATTMLRLPFKAPFDWDGVRAYLGARAIPGVETVRTNLYTRTMSSGGRHGIVRV
jgi:hypothetical protein